MIREHDSPLYYVGVGNGYKPYLSTLDGARAHIHYRVLRENGVSTAELIGPKIFFNVINDLLKVDTVTVPCGSGVTVLIQTPLIRGYHQ